MAKKDKPESKTAKAAKAAKPAKAGAPKEQPPTKVPARPAGPAGLVTFDDLERWFDEQFRNLGRGWFQPLAPRLFDFPEMPALQPPFEGRWPKVDVVDREADLLVRAELPGVTREGLDVSVTDRSVTIKATTRKETKEDKDQYHRREITAGAFERTLALPEDVDSAQAKASLKDGVLELVLPKRSKGPRQQVKVD